MPPLAARAVCNTPLITWLCDLAVATGVLARPACATATAERHVPCRHTRPLLGGVHCSAVRASASAAATATANLSCGVVVGGADATLGCKQASWIGISVWTRLRMRVGRGWALCVANAAFFAMASAHHPRCCLLPPALPGAMATAPCHCSVIACLLQRLVPVPAVYQACGSVPATQVCLHARHCWPRGCGAPSSPISVARVCTAGAK